MSTTTLAHSPASVSALADAADVLYVTAAESQALAHTELGRFVALVEALGPDDWGRPTACTAWNVQQMLAHQAGAYAAGARARELLRQFGRPPKPGQLQEDAGNEVQLADRAGRSPAELIAELKATWPHAARRRARALPVVRLITLPRPDGPGLNVGHLFAVIHTRDTWMHRLDISRATGRPMQLTAEHDGRVVALVLRDLAQTLGPKLGGQTVAFDLGGAAGGRWRIGPAAEPAATVQMDALDFNIYASGRYSYAEARQRAVIAGDVALGERALRETAVLY
jgi:uncharacterized protein (TIGR03083 family)